MFRKKRIPLDQFKSTKDLRYLSDDDLAERISGYKENTAKHILGMSELKRRQERGNTIRSWLAIIISIAALGLSFYKIKFEIELQNDKVIYEAK